MPAPESLMREKRRAILDAARDAFEAHGYEGASIAEITKAAGVSKPTVYHHFPSKAALFGAVVERECTAMMTCYFSDEVPHGDLVETLRTVGLGMLEMLTSSVCRAIDRIVSAEAAAFPELAEAFWSAGPRQAIDRLSTWLRAQSRAGLLAINDPELAAEQFFSLVQARVVLRQRFSVTEIPRADHPRLVAAAVDVFLHGYAATPAAGDGPGKHVPFPRSAGQKWP